ncbi:hypothetical protein NC653_025796 [Populus alba x Populus x berolinensis]|uniref:Uncharacterized protein n=1 Tax=Populus alba x Populus x berolinensis TaxID=444605 RepID=A0AAD6MC35_9ROSI|nr:hypothetical protein NC653_025796 [Populus alba x Populus x berolinensis]
MQLHRGTDPEKGNLSIFKSPICRNFVPTSHRLNKYTPNPKIRIRSRTATCIFKISLIGEGGRWLRRRILRALPVSFCAVNVKLNVSLLPTSHLTSHRNSLMSIKFLGPAMSQNFSTNCTLLSEKMLSILWPMRLTCASVTQFYGCVGVISLLQHQLRQLQIDLSCAKSELSKYQNLGITGHAGSLIAAAAAAATATATAHHHQHPQNLGINLIGAGGGSRDHHYHHQFFPKDQQQMMRSFDAGNNYDASLLAMNVSASIGQLNHFQQPRAAAGDDRRTIDPS